MDLFEEDYLDYDEFMRDSCPKCGHEYDDADYDFQICHDCGWDADNNKYSKVWQRVNCIECGKNVRYVNNIKELNSESRIDAFLSSEDESNHIGSVCWDCANSLCDKGIGYIVSGSDIPDFHYHKLCEK